MFWCDGCEQSDLVSAGVQPVFSHGEEGLESGGESLSGQVKAHSLFCVIHPWGLNVESVTGASLAFIFHMSHLKHANCEQNQLPNQIIDWSTIKGVEKLSAMEIQVDGLKSLQFHLKVKEHAQLEAFRDAKMSKCKYNGEIKLSQQSRIATSNEEEYTEEMPVNKSEMWSWEIPLEKNQEIWLGDMPPERWRGEEGGKALKKCKTVPVKGCIERSDWENASSQIRNVISRNMVTKNKEIWLGDMPPERWRNWRVGVRGPQWPSEIF